MIKIKTEKGYLDLGDSFRLDIEETNPVLNDRGSQSIPATVPVTKRNARIFGFAHRPDMATRPLAEDDSCTISDGVYVRQGKIHLVSAGRKEGYEFNIGLDTATTYSIWRAMSLGSLRLPTYEAGSVAALCQRMEDVMNGVVTDADYAVFQVTTNVAEKTDAIGEGDESTTRIYEYLNEMTVADPDTDAGDWTQVAQSLVWQARTKTILVGSEEVEVSLPAGYGVAPFLYVWKVLELVFAAYGYTLASNPFRTDETLKHLVILNNAADCCCTGTLRYADLMPECTIEELLDALHAKFGLVYDTNSNTGVARLYFLRDLVAPETEPDTDYSTRRLREPHITYEEPKQVKLTSQRSLEGAAPPNERYESFMRLSSGRIKSVARVKSSLAQPAWIMMERCTGKIWKYDEVSRMQGVVGSSNFDWDRQTDGVGTEEISSTDEMVAMDFGLNGILNPMYRTGYVHRYSEIKSSDVDVSEENAQTAETPLAFCLAFTRPKNCYTFGSTLLYTPWGVRVQLEENGENVYPEHSLLWQFDTGLFAHYWREYDAMLRHANNEVDVTVALTPAEVMQTDMVRPVSLMGQYLLPSRLSYSLPGGQRMPAELTLRTLRLVKPYDLDGEQGVPNLEPVEGHTYRWRIGSIVASWDQASRAEAIRAEYERENGVATQLNSYRLEYMGQTPSEWVDTLLPPVAATDTKQTTLTGRTVANLTAPGERGDETFDYSGSFRPDKVYVYLSAEVDS